MLQVHDGAQRGRAADEFSMERASGPGPEASNFHRWRRRSVTAATALLAWVAVCVVYGAVPFVAVPTLWQMLWSSGYALSFVNAGWPALYPQNFGLPGEPAMAFGLAGAILQSTIIHFTGLNPADAYTMGIALWLALAVYGGCQLARTFGLPAAQGAGLSMVYLTLPLVWWHSAYSYLSIGFALLPLYLFAALTVTVALPSAGASRGSRGAAHIHYVVVAILAVFIDGYTFIMLATMTVIMWMTAFVARSRPRISLIVTSAPTIAAGLGSAYLLFDTFMGAAPDWEYPLSFHRGWGLDLATLAIPSQHVMWLWDDLGVSAPRSGHEFYGDASSWHTNFAVPLIVVAIGVLYIVRITHVSAGLVIIALFGLYMALGPSLKIQSTRTPDDIEARGFSQLMPPEAALIATGNALLYRNVPGVKSMRATYRWVGITYIGLFGLLLLGAAELFRRGYGKYVYIAGSVLAASNIPNMYSHMYTKSSKYMSFWDIEETLIPTLSAQISSRDMIAFVPPYNDFFVNYLAARLDVQSYNIGGDKNLEIARGMWPAAMRSFPIRDPDACFSLRVQNLIVGGYADVVIVPFIDLLRDAQRWPPDADRMLQMRERYHDLLRALPESDSVQITETPFFFAIEPVPSAMADRAGATDHVEALCGMIEREWSGVAASVARLPTGVTLHIPTEAVRERCCGRDCRLVVGVVVEGATPERPVLVAAEVDGTVVRRWRHDSALPRVEMLRLGQMPAGGDDGYIALRLATTKTVSASAVEVIRLATSCRRWQGDSEAVHTAVGVVERGVLRTTGRSGFLMYGPYTELERGAYMVRLEGRVRGELGDAWLDISADAGQRQLKRLELAERIGPGSMSGTLLEIPVMLDDAARQLEVRIWVDEATDLEIRAFEIDLTEHRE